MGCFGMKLGMGYVVNKVLTLFDAGEIQQKEASDILKACRRGSHWCNELSDDYISPFGNFRCGCCLICVQSPIGLPRRAISRSLPVLQMSLFMMVSVRIVSTM